MPPVGRYPSARMSEATRPIAEASGLSVSERARPRVGHHGRGRRLPERALQRRSHLVAPRVARGGQALRLVGEQPDELRGPGAPPSRSSALVVTASTTDGKRPRPTARARRARAWRRRRPSGSPRAPGPTTRSIPPAQALVRLGVRHRDDADVAARVDRARAAVASDVRIETSGMPPISDAVTVRPRRSARSTTRRAPRARRATRRPTRRRGCAQLPAARAHERVDDGRRAENPASIEPAESASITAGSAGRRRTSCPARALPSTGRSSRRPAPARA